MIRWEGFVSLFDLGAKRIERGRVKREANYDVINNEFGRRKSRWKEVELGAPAFSRMEIRAR